MTGRRFAAMLAAVLAAVLAACTTTTTSTSTAAGSAPDARTSSDPGDADRRARLRLELAAGYFARGQTQTALEEVKLALAARPDMAEAHNLQGLIYAALNEPALAEQSFRRASQLAPRNPDTMHNYGWFLCQQRRYDESEAMFRQALAQPQYREGARTMFALGVCQARAGKWAEAEASLSRAYELDPTSPATAYNLAEVLYRRGDYERARFYIRRVNALAEASNAQSLWLAARVENKLGNPAGARAFGNQLRDRFPQSPEALQYERGRFDD
jgi:type IV pilus assembly protein PilF